MSKWREITCKDTHTEQSDIQKKNKSCLEKKKKVEEANGKRSLQC